MARLRLSLACWHYDRTHALADGSVRPEGIDLNYLDMHVEETFFRMLRNREFDVAEMSLSSYAVSVARDSPPFVAIPVFPSRFFRQSCIFVSEKSAIREPRDLIGKRIGTPEYQMTAPAILYANALQALPRERRARGAARDVTLFSGGSAAGPASSCARLSSTASSVRRVAATSRAGTSRTAMRFTSSASGTSLFLSARPLRVRKIWIFRRLPASWRRAI